MKKQKEEGAGARVTKGHFINWKSHARDANVEG